MNPEVPVFEVFEDAAAMIRRAAGEFVELAQSAVHRYGRFTVALSGGSTPKGLYEILSDPTQTFREQIPWEKTHFFWGDERHVPPEHKDSNYRMAAEAMLFQAPVPEENIHRVRGEEAEAGTAASEYETHLKSFFRVEGGGFPRFDLVLLGMGADGHTASLFPGTDVVFEAHRMVAPVWIEKSEACRITVTPPVLNNAACIIFLLAGEEKAAALQSVLHGEFHPEVYPSQIISPPNGRLLWLMDNGAAACLPEFNRPSPPGPVPSPETS